MSSCSSPVASLALCVLCQVINVTAINVVLVLTEVLCVLCCVLSFLALLSLSCVSLLFPSSLFALLLCGVFRVVLGCAVLWCVVVCCCMWLCCVCVWFCMSLCVLGEEWVGEGEGPCVDSKRLPCVQAPRPHVSYMWTWYQYTRGRFECTHGGVLHLQTGFFSLPHHTHNTNNTTHHHTHSTHTHHTETRRERETCEKRDRHVKRERGEDTDLYPLYFYGTCCFFVFLSPVTIFLFFYEKDWV